MEVTGVRFYLFFRKQANINVAAYFLEQDPSGGGGDYAFLLVTIPHSFWFRWLIFSYCANSGDEKYIQSP